MKSPLENRIKRERNSGKKVSNSLQKFQYLQNFQGISKEQKSKGGKMNKDKKLLTRLKGILFHNVSQVSVQHDGQRNTYTKTQK